MAEARWSPLAGMAAALKGASGRAVAIRELPFHTQISLRGDAADAGFLGDCMDALAVAPPTQAGAAAAASDVQILWLGPDEWLILAPESRRLSLIDALERSLSGRHVAVSDVSASRTLVELAGTRARHVLAKGCGLDLHPRAFATGRCAQTLIARTQVLLFQRSDVPAYWLSVRNSFAPYLAKWLLEAGAEHRSAPAA